MMLGQHPAYDDALIIRIYVITMMLEKYFNVYKNKVSWDGNVKYF